MAPLLACRWTVELIVEIRANLTHRQGAGSRSRRRGAAQPSNAGPEAPLKAPDKGPRRPSRRRTEARVGPFRPHPHPAAPGPLRNGGHLPRVLLRLTGGALAGLVRKVLVRLEGAGRGGRAGRRRGGGRRGRRRGGRLRTRG